MRHALLTLLVGGASLVAISVNAQETTQPPSPPPAAGEAPQGTAAPTAAEPAAPAAGGDTLPEVEVIQKKAEPQPAAPPKKVAAQPPPQPAPETAPAVAANPDEIPTDGPPPFDTEVKMSPLGGSEIPLWKVPGSVSRIDQGDIQEEGTRQIQQALQQKVPGIIVSDVAGSGFRSDVSFRGFDASPVGGRAQGLAVYEQGIRINESFGDIVNWDAIPTNAIADITVVTGNPVFGLNAIGGAIVMTMKDGFSFHGANVDVMGGSWGRKQVGTEAGVQSGPVAAYIAAEGVAEDGFRDFSEAEVRRMFTDLGFKGTAVEVHVNYTGAHSTAGVTTAAPKQLLDLGWNLTFTSPQITTFDVDMPSINAKVQATDTLLFSGLAYYRRFKQSVIDGNLSEAAPCTFDPAILCVTDDGEEEELEQANGGTVPSDIGDPLGSIERIDQVANSYGGILQATEKTPLFGHPNQFLVGGSFDQGEVAYNTSSEVGTIGKKFVVTGSGIIVVSPEDVAPRVINAQNTYYGAYFTDTFNVTDTIALTFGGRYNQATIQLTDLTGDFPELNSTNVYERFNPQIGGTYEFVHGISLYGGYSEANRAPTAAELSCADPENPCLIESFLTDDPPLKQVVSNTWEAGLRGDHKSYDRQRITWSVGLFHTLNIDDILNVAATQTGRGYFLNAGDTLRKGVEVATGYQSDRFSAYASYALVDATFEDDLVLPAPNTPGAPDCPDLEPGEEATCNFVKAGDRLPGIPLSRFKAGFDWWITPKWKFGADLIAASDQFFFGDEANNNAPLPGYTRVDLHTSYDINEHAQFYGLIKNLFDEHYGLYGTYFDTEEASEAGEPSGVSFTNPQSFVPAAPFAAYGGFRFQF